jgi:hypothetical protein
MPYDTYGAGGWLLTRAQGKTDRQTDRQRKSRATSRGRA